MTQVDASPTPNAATPRRPPTLGVVALVLAAVFSSILWALTLPFYFLRSLPLPPDPTGFGWPVFAQTAGLLVALILGVGAVITRRGRWWGLAAIFFAILGSFYVNIGLALLIPGKG